MAITSSPKHEKFSVNFNAADEPIVESEADLHALADFISQQASIGAFESSLDYSVYGNVSAVYWAHPCFNSLEYVGEIMLDDTKYYQFQDKSSIGAPDKILAMREDIVENYDELVNILRENGISV